MGNYSPDAFDIESRSDFRRYAKDLLRMRKARRRYLNESLISGPAWDLMVALTSLETETCSITKLSDLADVALTTALRQLHHLEEAGLVKRTEHLFDRRAVDIHLTDEGRGAMEKVLAAAHWH